MILFSIQALPVYNWNDKLPPLVVIFHVPSVSGGHRSTDHVLGSSISQTTSSVELGTIVPIPSLRSVPSTKNMSAPTAKLVPSKVSPIPSINLPFVVA